MFIDVVAVSSSRKAEMVSVSLTQALTQHSAGNLGGS